MCIFGEASDGSVDHWSRNPSCTNGEDEMRKFLTNTSEILEKVKKRFYRCLAPMKQRKLLKKISAMILKVDVMIFTVREIIYYLDDSKDLSNISFYQRERMKEDLLDGLRNLIKDRLFYTALLEGENGKANSRLFRSLKKNGLVDIKGTEFRAMTKRCSKDIYTDQTLSGDDIYRLLVLRDLAKKMIKEGKTKISTNPSSKRKLCCTSGRDETRNSTESGMPHDLYAVIQAKPVLAIRYLPQVLASLKEEEDTNEQVDVMNKGSITTEPHPLSPVGDKKHDNRLRRAMRRLANLFHS